MSRLVPLRRGERWSPRDDVDRCPVVRFGDTVDRCTSRALPHHDLHAASGIDGDGEVYGCAWITRAALPAPEHERLRVDPPVEHLAGAILALGYATDETSARYWLAVCARRGAEQPLLDHLWSTWQREHLPTLMYTDPGDDPR